MKASSIIIFLFAVCYVECRKIYPQINKQANVDFINMEGGPGGLPVKPPGKTDAVKPIQPTTSPVPGPLKPITTPNQKANNPLPTPTTIKPTPPTSGINTATVKPKIPTSATNTSVNQPKVPASGKVADLVNFYDSQGKASPIRPYSYSQAVKQG